MKVRVNKHRTYNRAVSAACDRYDYCPTKIERIAVYFAIHNEADRIRREWAKDRDAVLAKSAEYFIGDQDG